MKRISALLHLGLYCGRTVLCIIVTLFIISERGMSSQKKKIIFGTDIATDIDDAYAHAIVQISPEFEILSITTADGKTAMRARVSYRMLWGNAIRRITPLPSVEKRGLGANRQHQSRGETGSKNINQLKNSQWILL
jgi:inosine-uridine nucleoside N-ribohydrolase